MSVERQEGAHTWFDDISYKTLNNKGPVVQRRDEFFKSAESFHQLDVHFYSQVGAVSFVYWMFFFVQNYHDITRFDFWVLKEGVSLNFYRSLHEK